MGPQRLTALRAGPALRAGGITLVPVEEIRASVQWSGGRVFGSGGKRPVAVVAIEPGGTRAWDDAGRPMSLDELLERVSGLRESLE